jgi:two-component system, NarL family, sensor histidine kinase YdfH
LDTSVRSGRMVIVHSYTVLSNNGRIPKPIYNLVKMQNRPSKNMPSIDRDTRLFMGFLTLVVATMYVITLINVPAVRQPLTLIVFTLLIIIHLALHWFLENITVRSMKWATWYIILQGLLAFTIALISGTMGMVFALFMGLIGESVGLLGLKRWGLLALSYYLLLAMICFYYFVGPASIGWWALGTIPIVLFIVIYVTLYTRQAEARAQTQALLLDLEKANQQLSEYADRVEDLTIANERQRMARELHDTLSQGLAGLILQLEAVDANLAGNHTEKARVITQQTMEHARATLEAARHAIDNLRQSEPMNLDDSLRLESSRFTGTSRIPCELHLNLTQPVSEHIRDAIIRSVAEAFNNIAHHADASQVSLEATVKDNLAMVVVKDNGKGFNPDHIPAGHYGILGVRERLRLVGGQLEIESSPEKGTILTIQIPINNQVH